MSQQTSTRACAVISQMQATSIMNLSHNQLSILFDSLQLSDILKMRLINKQMNEQVKLYLEQVYIPRHFSNFNLEEEKQNIEQLQKRQLSLNFSTILNQEAIKSLQNLSATHQELVQNIYSCYNILQQGMFAYDKGTNQQVFNQQLFQEFSQNFDINKLTIDILEQLTEQVQKISMSVITPQMRYIALMVRTFSQLVMNYQYSNKLKSTKLRVGQFQTVQNIIKKQYQI